MEGISRITYKDREILYTDYSHIGTSKTKVLDLIHRVANEISKHPPQSVLALTNIADLHFDLDIILAFKKARELTTSFERKVAFIGVNGLIKVVFNSIVDLTNQHITRAFETEMEAKEWLVEQG
ncbi:MAG TPA: hypothetical protein VHY08_07770 [Bacillota bacterium]|nr:hypothetical protein [Bacillota bacterium]